MSSTPWRTTRRVFALHQGKADWYRIRNQSDGPTIVSIFDEIGYFGVTADSLIRDLSDVRGPIEVHLNSPGGEVSEGLTIYNTLMERSDVTVKIYGMAASIASVIAMAASSGKLLIARQGEMMIHDGFSMAIGNAEDLRKLADRLDETSTSISEIYAEHTGQSASFWREKMQAETWYRGQQAIDAGLADDFLAVSSRGGDSDEPESTEWNLDVYHSRPGRVRNVADRRRNAASVPWVGERQTRHEPMTGKHRHDHAAGGADDHDDGIHYHLHEHHNDADHNGHSHSSGMGNEGEEGGAVGFMTAKGMAHLRVLSETQVLFTLNGHSEIFDWNASAAYAKCKTAADFKKIAFEKDNDSDPTSAEHYGLPHHAAPGAGPDKAGVVAALGRWNQTDDLKNKDADLAHLKAHARDLGLPSGDDDGDNKTVPWIDFGDEEFANVMASLRGERR